MSKMTMVTFFVALMFMALYVTFWYRLAELERISLQEYVLTKQVNHASDAAIDELLYSADLEQDYNSDAILVQPDIAVREFSTILAKSFGYDVTEKTLQDVQNKYIKTLVVCAWDGVYAYYKQPTETHGDGFVSTPKLPYFYTEGKGSSMQKQYLLNLGMEKGYCDEIDADGNYRLNNYDDINLSEDVQRTAINNRVSEILQWSLIQAYGGSSRANYTIPAYASEISGAQPVEGVSVIGVVDKDSPGTITTAVAMGIGGSRIEETDPILGFTANGIKYYMQQSKIAGSPYAGATIERTFESVFDAAKAGYHSILEEY